jgi:O-antigen/teichoic acid export membrane protein
MLAAGLLGPYVRLAGMLALLAPLGALGYLLAQLGTSGFGVCFGLVVLYRALSRMGCRVSYRPHAREMLAFALPLVALTLVGRIQGPVEAMVIRHRLPTIDSAGYYYAVMLGNIPGYFTGAMIPFLWPILSDRFERGQQTEGLLIQSMLFNLVLGAAFVGLFALVMPWFFTLPGPWKPYGAYAGFVWQAALIGTLKTAQAIYTAHEMACRRFIYMRYLIPLILAECALLYVLPGWAALRPWLPATLWNWVASRYQPSLQGFVTTMLLANAAFTGGMLLEWLLRRRK